MGYGLIDKMTYRTSHIESQSNPPYMTNILEPYRSHSDLDSYLRAMANRLKNSLYTSPIGFDSKCRTHAVCQTSFL